MSEENETNIENEIVVENPGQAIDMVQETMETEMEVSPRDEALASTVTLEQTSSDDELGLDILTQEEAVAESPQDGERLLEEAIIDEAPAAEIEDVSPHEAFSYALMEIKRTIKAEFEALRAELKLWRQGR